MLVKDACIEEFDPYKIKNELKTLVLDPIESQRDVVTRGWSRAASKGTARGNSHARSRVNASGSSRSEGESRMDGESTGTAFSSGHVSGSQSGIGDGETILPGGEVIETLHQTGGTSEADIDSHTDTHSETHSRGTHRSQSIQASHAEGEVEATQEMRNLSVSAGVNESKSRVPFYEYEKQWLPSSITFESEQEFLTTKLQRVKGQPKAHAFIKVPGKPGCFVALPWVKDPWVSAKTRAAGLQRVFSQPFYARRDKPPTPESAAGNSAAQEALAEREKTASIYRVQAALPAPNTNPITKRKEEPLLAPAGANSLKPATDDENFAGPDKIILKPPKTKRKKR